MKAIGFDSEEFAILEKAIIKTYTKPFILLQKCYRNLTSEFMKREFVEHLEKCIKFSPLNCVMYSSSHNSDESSESFMEILEKHKLEINQQRALVGFISSKAIKMSSIIYSSTPQSDEINKSDEINEISNIDDLIENSEANDITEMFTKFREFFYAKNLFTDDMKLDIQDLINEKYTESKVSDIENYSATDAIHDAVGEYLSNVRMLDFDDEFDEFFHQFFTQDKADFITEVIVLRREWHYNYMLKNIIGEAIDEWMLTDKENLEKILIKDEN